MKRLSPSSASGAAAEPTVRPEIVWPRPSNVPAKAQSLPPMGVHAASETSISASSATYLSA